MTDEWKQDYPSDAADLEWWEAAFGKGNVVGWTRRNSALVDWAGKRRSVDPEMRAWIFENSSGGARQ